MPQDPVPTQRLLPGEGETFRRTVHIIIYLFYFGKREKAAEFRKGNIGMDESSWIWTAWKRKGRRRRPGRRRSRKDGEREKKGGRGDNLCRFFRPGSPGKDSLLFVGIPVHQYPHPQPLPPHRRRRIRIIQQLSPHPPLLPRPQPLLLPQRLRRMMIQRMQLQELFPNAPAAAGLLSHPHPSFPHPQFVAAKSLIL